MILLLKELEDRFSKQLKDIEAKYDAKIARENNKIKEVLINLSFNIFYFILYLILIKENRNLDELLHKHSNLCLTEKAKTYLKIN